MSFVIYLDTTCLRSMSPAYKRELEKLVDAGFVTIQIPHIALEEWRTQKRDNAENDIRKLAGIANKLLGNPLVSDNYKKHLRVLIEHAEREIEFCDKESHQVANRLLPKEMFRRIPHRAKSLNDAIKAYFSGNDPYTRPRHRDHIPDAIIYQAIKHDIRNFQNARFIVITNDKNLGDACGRIAHHVFATVQEFRQDKTMSKLWERAGEFCDMDEERYMELIQETFEQHKLFIQSQIESIIRDDPYDIFRTGFEFTETETYYSKPKDIVSCSKETPPSEFTIHTYSIDIGVRLLGSYSQRCIVAFERQLPDNVVRFDARNQDISVEYIEMDVRVLLEVLVVISPADIAQSPDVAPNPFIEISGAEVFLTDTDPTTAPNKSNMTAGPVIRP